MTTLDKVREFHNKFKHAINNKPTLSDRDLTKFRVFLIREELNELEEAINKNDKVKVLDALTDIQYVLDGTYIALGFADVKYIAFEEVHHSNMTKDFNGSMKPTKGKNYIAPNLNKFIKN